MRQPLNPRRLTQSHQAPTNIGGYAPWQSLAPALAIRCANKDNDGQY